MLSLNEKKKESNLEQGKILTIDSVNKKVTLLMRNGLVTSGTYSEETTGLATNMSVLIGKVSNAYLVMSILKETTTEAVGYTIAKI